MIKDDLVDFSIDYTGKEALNRYGVEYEELKAETQNELWKEAEQVFYENKVDDADIMRKRITEADIDEFLETQAEAQRELKEGWVN